MNIIEIDLDRLTLDPKNARKHDANNIKMLKASLAEFGQQKLPVISNDNIVVAGNGTVMAARELGWKKIFVVVSNLTDTKALAYSIADNQIATTSSWDLEVYGLNLKEIKDAGWLQNWNALGFEKDEVNLLLSADWDSPEPAGNSDKEPDKSGLKEEMGKPIKLTAEQREIINQAIQILRTKENDSRISEGRALEFICIEYINTP